MMTTVMPSFLLMSPISSRIWRVVLGSSALVASSQSRTLGFVARAGDGHALLLSAGELRGIGLGLILEPHDLEEFQSSLFAPLLLSPQAGKLHREADVIETVSLHQQVEALEDHRDLAPRRAELRGGHRVQTLSVHDDLALRRALEHIDAAHERGFAGAAHADDAVDVAVWNGQGDVLERVYPSAGCFKGFA